MTAEEFKRRRAADEDWAPGWEAIEGELERLYPGQRPDHLATNLAARAAFSGDEYLDGCSLYLSKKGYRHIVSFGMSELYANEEALGGDFSRWGYEMTIKLPETDTERCYWAVNVLRNLAAYTYTQNRFFAPGQFISGDGNPLCRGSDSEITALLVVPDTELRSLNTIYGRLEFLQMVGITSAELEAISADESLAAVLTEKLRAQSPDLVTDLGRKGSLI